MGTPAPVRAVIASSFRWSLCVCVMRTPARSAISSPCALSPRAIYFGLNPQSISTAWRDPRTSVQFPALELPRTCTAIPSAGSKGMLSW